MKAIFVIVMFFLVIVSGFYFYPEYAIQYSTLLRLDTNSPGGLPGNFRTTPLRASGSAQFSEAQLQAMLQEIPDQQVTLVDLRGEPHVFLNGDSVSWYTVTNGVNEGKTVGTIERDDQDKCHRLSESSLAVLYRKMEHTPHFYFVKDVASPSDIAKRNEVDYIRFPISDHKQPTDCVVDQFIEFYKNRNNDMWLHFYCSAGKGRTTTFLAMIDMMQNAPHKSLDQIVAEQESYGGLNLFKSPDPKKWKYPYIVARAEFIREFYQYCMENPDCTVSWSDWKKDIMKEKAIPEVDAQEFVCREQ